MVSFPVVYFASPLDRVTGTEVWAAVQDVELTVRLHAVVYNPQQAWSIPTGAAVSQHIQLINNAAVQAADVLVAVLPDTPSIGVGREIELAARMGKPVLVVCPDPETRWSLADVDTVDMSLPDDQVESEIGEWFAQLVRKEIEDVS